MAQVSHLYVYPIKSLGGVSVTSVNITDRGFEHDRRWMLIDEHNNFLTQRECTTMALLQVDIKEKGLTIFHKQNETDRIIIPYVTQNEERVATNIWGVPCKPVLVSEEADKWFSKMLGINCRLVYMDDSTRVPVDERYNIKDDLTSFSDGYPILMISEASLNDLNRKTGEKIPMNRFRPNLVISNSNAFEEDGMKEFIINGIGFYGVKPSSRCVVTTIDQQTASRGKEPLRTLSTYRSVNNKIYFGENVIAASTGMISVGDDITILKTKETLFQQ